MEKEFVKCYILVIVIINSLTQNNPIQMRQQFSTWGTRTPRGTPKAHRGVRKQFVGSKQL
jgi:hypothetical protein